MDNFHSYYEYIKADGAELFTVVCAPNKVGKFPVTFTLGKGERSYNYDPLSPASFKGGLSHNFGGTDWQDKPNQRDDINKISNFTENYVTASEITVDFTFDPIAFTVKKGERLRIDISSSCFPNFSIHTNKKGHYALLTDPVVATNTVILDDSYLTVFAE